MKKVSQRYTEFLQVYFIAGDLDAVGPEAVGLFVGTAEGKGTGEFPFGIDHAVAGDMVGIRILCRALPTARAIFGSPAMAATCPYVATQPFGIFFTAS